MLISQPTPTTNSCRNYSAEPQTLSGWVALTELSVRPTRDFYSADKQNTDLHETDLPHQMAAPFTFIHPHTH